MHDRIEASPLKGAIQRCGIQQIGLDELTPTHRIAMPGGEVVQHGDGVAVFAQPVSHVAADVAGAAADEDVGRL
ncbi:hypothetical protein D3C71_1044220 [compost metagenome]